MDANETLADIVAELQQKSYDAIACGMQGYSDKLDDLAERIDAAAKREELRWAKANGDLARMLDLEKTQGGNAAKLREAAEEARIMAEGMWNNTKSDDWGGLVVKCEEALASPPRNCDVLGEEDAAKAFKEENCDQYENSFEDPRTCCEGRCVECVVHWMLATATQEKGGDK